MKMKRRNLKYFTLMELLFVIGILVILVGISWVAGTKVLRSQTKNKTKAEIMLLSGAIEQYRQRFGHYPPQAGNTTLNFGEYLSKVLPNGQWTDASGSSADRPMLVDFDKEDIIVDNSSYAAHDADTTIVMDPYENEYMYLLSNNSTSFLIYSKGLDGEHGSGSNYNNKEDYEANTTHTKNEDNVVSNDL